MYRDQNRAFNYAVLFSILLHGLLLFAFPGLRDPAKRSVPPAPIVARLVQVPAEPAPAAVQPEPLKPQAREKPMPPTAKQRPIAKPLAKAQPKAPAPEPKPEPEPKAAAPEPSAPVAEEAPAAPAAPAAPEVPAVIARMEPAPAAAPPSVETVDTGSLAQYRLQLLSAARKYKHYPRVAMDNNWEGDVVVRMVIGANGMISALSIKTSSGHEVLDEQALQMFKKAKPLVPIPAALRGREFTIELRAIYNLKDQDSG
jgi:periplasmic protein TonB